MKAATTARYSECNMPIADAHVERTWDEAASSCKAASRRARLRRGFGGRRCKAAEAIQGPGNGVGSAIDRHAYRPPQGAAPG